MNGRADNHSTGTTPELLAPAGGWPQLKAAIRFGADAVYLACDKFGMRARADNFALEDLPSAVGYAHDRGVNVHVAANVLMGQDDLPCLPGFFEAVQDAGADALIIGDLGAFSLAGRYAPRVERHVSTQASVMNAEAARMWYELGASRVVCAREMSLADIADMREKLPSGLQVEAFVHGAMCVAYSGRCLLSAAMTGRTANKGACAQACRWSYALVEEQRPGEYFEIREDVRGSYVLNAQDLNMVRHLDDLARAGVDSLKVEGRNKQAFYVATVVGAYRSALDGGDVDVADAELHAISHRPYGTGFYFGRPDQTPERDGYVKECLHVATVEDCVPAAQGVWRVTALCHNRFAVGDALEALRPRRAPEGLRVANLARLAPSDGGKPFVERGDLPLEAVRARAIEQPELVANRSKEHYLFDVLFPLDPGDYLRRRV